MRKSGKLSNAERQARYNRVQDLRHFGIDLPDMKPSFEEMTFSVEPSLGPSGDAIFFTSDGRCTVVAWMHILVLKSRAVIEDCKVEIQGLEDIELELVAPREGFPCYEPFAGLIYSNSEVLNDRLADHRSFSRGHILEGAILAQSRSTPPEVRRCSGGVTVHVVDQFGNDHQVETRCYVFSDEERKKEARPKDRSRSTLPVTGGNMPMPDLQMGFSKSGTRRGKAKPGPSQGRL